MTALSVFVSFEYDKDNDLKNNFFSLARDNNTPHRLENSSLNESYRDDEWKSKAREAIRGCDVVVVLLGEDTHSARGVLVETSMARSFEKPVIQIVPQERPYRDGLPYLKGNQPIPWKWPIINREFDRVISSERR